MEQRFVKGVSAILHPLMIPCYVLLLLLNHKYFVTLLLPLNLKLMLTGMVCLTTILFPIFTTWMMYRLGLISELSLRLREQRFFPLLIVAFFYHITFYLVKGFHVSTIFSYYMLGAALLAIVISVLSFYRKISIYMTAMGTVTGLLIGLTLNFGLSLYTEIMIAILIGGVAGYARLKNGDHTPMEIYSGFLIGVAGMTTMMLFL